MPKLVDAPQLDIVIGGKTLVQSLAAGGLLFMRSGHCVRRGDWMKTRMNVALFAERRRFVNKPFHDLLDKRCTAKDSARR